MLSFILWTIGVVYFSSCIITIHEVLRAPIGPEEEPKTPDNHRKH